MPEMPAAIAEHAHEPRALVYTPLLSADLVALIPALAASMEAPKPTRAWVLGELARISIHTWQPDRPLEQQRQLANDYADELADCPQYALEAAFRECRRTCRFFPRLAEILEAVGKADRKRLVAKHGLMMLAMKAKYDGPPKPPSTPLTAEQQAEVDQILAGYRRTGSSERKGAAA